MKTAAPELLPLFRSAAQARILTVLLLAPPKQSFSIEDVSGQAGTSYATTHREVTRLISAGVLSDKRVGNLRVIRANRQSPYHVHLRGLIEQAFGPESLLRTELSDLSGVSAAAIYGSYAARLLGEPGDAPRDIDVLVIGAPDLDVLYERCERVSEIVKREVNPTVVSDAEWQYGYSGFVRQIRRRPLVRLIGQWNEPPQAPGEAVSDD